MAVNQKIINRLEGRKKQVEQNEQQIEVLKGRLAEAETMLNDALDNGNVADTISLQRTVRDVEDEIQAMQLINERLASTGAFTLEEFEKLWDERAKEIRKEMEKVDSKMNKLKEEYEKELAKYVLIQATYGNELIDWEWRAFESGITTAEGKKYWVCSGVNIPLAGHYIPRV